MSVARQCPQCGAQVDLPPERIADLCAFCASPLVDAAARSDHADLVAPFDLSQAVAARRLGRYLQDKWFLPSKLKEAGKPESLHGVLVPFWSYAATARSDWTAQQGIHWTRVETYTTVVDGKTIVRTRTVTETEWFDSSGTHVATYDDHLVSGSRGLSEAEANELEPFDLGKALPFTPEFLAGWVAEAPTVPRTEAREVADRELADTENAAIATFLPADRTAGVESTTSIQVTDLKLVLLPVWIGTWRYKGEPLRLLVNAQTGEVVGELPTDWLKVTLLVLATLFVTGGLGLMAMLVLAILGSL